MSKKDCLLSFSDKPSLKNKHLRCSLCHTEAESIFYICKCGRHFICKTCQYQELSKHKHENGDHKTEKESVRHRKKEISYNNPEEVFHDLASGDHFDSDENKSGLKFPLCHEIIKKNNKVTTSTPKETLIKTDFGVMVNMDNSKCHEIKSNASTNSVFYDLIIEEKPIEQDPRPITCPITECSRIVTLDSFSHHFNFDHSKVPKFIFDETISQEISINYSTLSAKAKCVASFVTSLYRLSDTTIKMEDSPTSLTSYNKSNTVLLLMVAKIPISVTNKLFCNTNLNISTKNSYTQTEISKKNYKQSNLQCVSKTSSINTVTPNKAKSSCNKEEEIILLWLCKFDNKDSNYTIMAMRKDKKQGYSYSGDAVYIRREHDPLSIYNNAKCLSITRTALTKLVTDNELKVFVSSIL